MADKNIFEELFLEAEKTNLQVLMDNALNEKDPDKKKVLMEICLKENKLVWIFKYFEFEMKINICIYYTMQCVYKIHMNGFWCIFVIIFFRNYQFT